MENPERRIPHKGLIVAALLVTVLAAAAALVNIREVTIQGNSRYTEAEIAELIFQKKTDYNSALFFLREKTKDHIQIPFVEDYQIRFINPCHVEIIVHEKSVVGYVPYMGSYMYFDKDGIVVESTGQALEGIPCVEGLRFGQIVLYQPLPVEDKKIFEEILNLTQMLSVHGLNVDKIHYNSKGEANLYFGNVEVVLGDSAQMDGKISLLSDMMSSLEGLDGTLYLDNYDENKEGLITTFKRNWKE